MATWTAVPCATAYSRSICLLTIPSKFVVVFNTIRNVCLTCNGNVRRQLRSWDRLLQIIVVDLRALLIKNHDSHTKPARRSSLSTGEFEEQMRQTDSQTQKTGFDIGRYVARSECFRVFETIRHVAAGAALFRSTIRSKSSADFVII